MPVTATFFRSRYYRKLSIFVRLSRQATNADLTAHRKALTEALHAAFSSQGCPLEEIRTFTFLEDSDLDLLYAHTTISKGSITTDQFNEFTTTFQAELEKRRYKVKLQERGMV